MTNEECPICEEGTLFPTTETRTIGKTPWEEGDIKVVMCYSVCDVCQVEITNGPQSERNAQRVRDARDGKL